MPPMTLADRRRRMLDGPVARTILALSAPNVAGVAGQTAVAIADAWFVGKLGTVPLAALSLVFPTQMMLGMMSAGAMGGGVSSAVARALGAGDRARAASVATHAILLGLGMSALFAIVFVGFGPSVYRLIGGSGEALGQAVLFARVLFLGAVVVWTANMFASILRGCGDTATPGRALLIGALAQVPLSGALTLGLGPIPALGVTGPAAAAVLSFALAAAIMARRLFGASAASTLDGAAWRQSGAVWVDILKVGIVSSLVVVLTNVTIMSVTGLVGRGGPAALAGYGIGSRLEYMLIPIAFGVGAALTAMVGTNFGAGRYRRARRIAWTGAAMAGAAAGLIGLVVAVFPDLWLGMFTRDPGVLAQGRLYLAIVGPVYGLFGLAMALYFASQGTGSMVWPLGANIARIAIVLGGGGVVLDGLGLGTAALFACVACGITVFAGTLFGSTFSRTWIPRPDTRP
ncbi:MAG: MATE family efflux transporter [Rhodospirillales bacterium]|nr:MAG: MATE family efflux transporter [Rhodospirillales bacterium]